MLSVLRHRDKNTTNRIRTFEGSARPDSFASNIDAMQILATIPFSTLHPSR
jgi:hypothetical protein